MGHLISQGHFCPRGIAHLSSNPDGQGSCSHMCTEPLQEASESLCASGTPLAPPAAHFPFFGVMVVGLERKQLHLCASAHMYSPQVCFLHTCSMYTRIPYMYIPKPVYSLNCVFSTMCSLCVCTCVTCTSVHCTCDPDTQSLHCAFLHTCSLLHVYYLHTCSLLICISCTYVLCPRAP